MVGILPEKSDERDIVSNTFLFGVDNGMDIELKIRHGILVLLTEILQSKENNVLS